MKFFQKFRTILLVFLSFGFYYILDLNFVLIKSKFDGITHQGLVSYVLTYILIGVPILIGTIIINKSFNVFRSLGLSSNIITGIWTSFIFSIPMFFCGISFFNFNAQIEFQSLLAGTIVAGFMEELYFRGFLFGQLFRNTKLGFIASIFFGALIFAFGHLYQSQNVNELIGIFIVTFFGAIFFAWLFVEWNYNLWVPILTHSLMNLSWNIFQIDNSALGNFKANIFRSLTIIIAIIFTVVFKKYKNEKLIINKSTLLFKKTNDI